MSAIVGVVLLIFGILGLVSSALSHDALAWTCLIAGIVLLVFFAWPYASKR